MTTIDMTQGDTIQPFAARDEHAERDLRPRSGTPLRVAIVHEWLLDWAGSERVLEQIVACYPTADLFALVDFLSPEHRSKLLGKHATTTFLQRLPFARSHLHLYLTLMPIAIEQLDLSPYDLIISSSHAVAKGIITSPSQVHISYVHSPMRYAWDQQHQYLRGRWGRGLTGAALRLALHYLRMWDLRTSSGVQAYAANSSYVGKRIWKLYRRTSAVIHPPVDLEKFVVGPERSGDFYLCASRLMPYKRVDVVVDAFRKMPDRKLVIIGDGPEYKSLKRIAGANIEMLGFQPTDTLIEHLQRAKALIFAAEEDFGILPLEAQACGTPVIAYGKGGALETIRGIESPQPTGLFFYSQTDSAVVDAVERFESHTHAFSPLACRANAERFSAPHFREEFRRFVESQVETALIGTADQSEGNKMREHL